MTGKRGIIFLISLIVSCCLVSGCVNNHEKEFIQANSLLESANSRFLGLNTGNLTMIRVEDIRANASAATRDLTEARRILEKIPPGDLKTQDQADLKALIQMLNGTIELTEIIEGPLADVIEDAQVLVNSKDPATFSDAGLRFKQDLERLRMGINNLKTEFNAIDDTGLSPKVRETLNHIRTSITSFAADIDTTSARLADACIKKCPVNEVLGTDCQCHTKCGFSYCAWDAVCRNNVCYRYPGLLG